MKPLNNFILIIVGLFLLTAFGCATQKQKIIASYYREAAAGKVPMPVNKNGVQVFAFEPLAPLDRVYVETKSGTLHFLAKTSDDSGTNWVFTPR